MSSQLVSIIIPCFNAEPWLAATLESALCQSWPHKEILFIDDGSSDNSLNIARKFESRGVRILNQANQGASAARNRGLARAAGEYIQYLDADDLLHPRKIEMQVNALRGGARGIVASGRWGRFVLDPQSARFVDGPIFRDLDPIEFLQLAAEKGCMMHPAAWLTPRAIANAAGEWNETLSLNDDGEYFARVLLASKGIIYCPDAECYYRSEVPRSLSDRKDNEAKESLFRSIELIVSHMLRVKDSPETHAMAASYFLHVFHSVYPAPRSLTRQISSRISAFGGSITAPPMGPRESTLAKIIGWRLARRITASRRRQSRS